SNTSSAAVFTKPQARTWPVLKPPPLWLAQCRQFVPWCPPCSPATAPETRLLQLSGKTNAGPRDLDPAVQRFDSERERQRGLRLRVLREKAVPCGQDSQQAPSHSCNHLPRRPACGAH